MAECKNCGHDCHCEMMCDECVGAKEVCTNCNCQQEEDSGVPSSFTQENV